MKPQELYEMEPQEISHRPCELAGCYYNHIKESGIDGYELGWDVETDRLEIRIIKHHNFDHRRFWRLATVWFDGKPVMVIQNAGRDGDDFRRRIITDADSFRAMCSHIASLKPVTDIEDVVDPQSDVDGLTDFYGNHLGGMFEIYTY